MTKIPPVVSKIKKYLAVPKPEVNYAEGEKSISFSQLQMYYDCEHKWNLKYKQGLEDSSFSINLTFGTALHETLQNYFNVMYDEGGLKADNINLEEYFQESLTKNYQKDYEKNKNHFSSAEEMNEFYEDGIAILEFFKKNRSKYFSKRGWHLIGCEIPLQLVPYKNLDKIIFKGYLDMVLYNENTDNFYIYDFKTTRSSWGDKEKKDKIKQSQLILYKEFFARTFDIPKDKIKVEFFILKRKLWESQYPQKRIQQFVPAHGDYKIKESLGYLEKFMNECFDKNGYKDREFKKNPSSKCKFCPFNERLDLCNKNINNEKR